MGKSVSVGDTLPHTVVGIWTEQVLTRAGGRVEVVASLSQGRTAAAQCGLFTYKSVPGIFEPLCTFCRQNKRLLKFEDGVVCSKTCTM